jgi:hypothetical protein
MRTLVLLIAILLSSSAMADSCVTLEITSKGPTVINRCEVCMNVTVRELRPREEQATGMFASEPRLVRVEAEGRAGVQGSERLVITDLKACD